MTQTFLNKLKLDSFLSFAPGSDAFELKPLNVLIGPNGSGKSNIIEAIELLRATPTNFATAIRDGGGPSEWLWKGPSEKAPASIDTVVGPAPTGRPLRYRLAFTSVQQRVEVLDEAIEEVRAIPPNEDVFFYYRFQSGRPVINVRETRQVAGNRPYVERHLERQSLAPDQSVLSQRKDPDLYPEITWTGQKFGAIQIFREWAFGRYADLRKPQPADLPDDSLEPDARNLALVLNQIEHRNGRVLDEYVRRFFPRFERLSTRVSGGTVQFFMHEPGFRAPIPSTRLSDGTIRFLALLAALLAPEPPWLLCIEEPELGLHPDAMSLMAELLVDTSQRTQIVVTTHSDALVSELTEHAESVVICERPGEGTTLRRVESVKLQHWLDKYRLGEIWRIGELGGNP